MLGPSIGVGEIQDGKLLRPYPGGTWNETEGPAESRFTGVNAVVSDSEDRLWVVDAGAGFNAAGEGSPPKLVWIDLATDQVKRIYRFDSKVAPSGAFTNDVRVGKGHAFLTDSGLGALIVLDLESGEARRVLAEDKRLKADPALELKVQGQNYVNAKGETPRMHVNPMELSPDEKFLYFQPSGGPRLYRIEVDRLIDPKSDEAALEGAVEDCGPTRFTAGLTMTADGSLYYSDIESGGITRRKPDGTMEPVVVDARLVWPDESHLGPDGYLYFPVAQVNRLPSNSPGGTSRMEFPFRIFKVKLPE
jgi:sugar lactone lactonase YvrE